MMFSYEAKGMILSILFLLLLIHAHCLNLHGWSLEGKFLRRSGCIQMSTLEDSVSLFQYDPKKIRNFSIIAHIGK